MPWSFGLLKFLTPPKEAQLWSCRPKNGKRANFLKVWLQDSKIYGKWTKMSCIVAFYFVQNYGETPLRHCPNGDGIQDRGQARQAPKIPKNLNADVESLCILLGIFDGRRTNHTFMSLPMSHIETHVIQWPREDFVTLGVAPRLIPPYAIVKILLKCV